MIVYVTRRGDNLVTLCTHTFDEAKFQMIPKIEHVLSTITVGLQRPLCTGLPVTSSFLTLIIRLTLHSSRLLFRCAAAHAPLCNYSSDIDILATLVFWQQYEVIFAPLTFLLLFFWFSYFLPQHSFQVSVLCVKPLRINVVHWEWSWQSDRHVFDSTVYDVVL